MATPASPTKLMGSEVSRHIRELVWPRKWSIALAVLVLLINRAAGLVLPGSLKFLIDDVVLNRNAGLLYPLAAAVGGALLIHAMTAYSLQRLLSIPAANTIAMLRSRLQAHIGRLPIRYLDTTKTGVLVSRIMKDVDGVRNLIGPGVVELIGGCFTAVIVFVVLMRINVTLTLVVLGFLSLFVMFSQRTLAKLRPIFREQAEINAEVTGRLTESLSGIRVVKGFHGESREAATFYEGAMRLFGIARRQFLATARATCSVTLLLAVGTTTVIIVGGRMLLTGAMSVGDAFAFLLFVGLAISPVFAVIQVGTQVMEAFAGLDRMHEILSQPPEDVDPRRTVSIGAIRGHVMFDNVTFEYEPGRPVLKNISLNAPPGTVTALVGSSGAGKSTLISLVAAFASPTSGLVSVDGCDLSTVRLDSFRTQIGVVLQDNFLFDGTIADNIRFGRPYASDEDVMRAAGIARVDEFTARLDKGLETIIGERGVKLSGGQRQRVAIARAILADPRILILDEATSSLDSESEELIQHGLAALMQGRTTFVIAHRLSTIRLADQILVLESGVIVERGTHAELLARRGRYFELYTRQVRSDPSHLLEVADQGSAVRVPYAATAAQS